MTDVGSLQSVTSRTLRSLVLASGLRYRICWGRLGLRLPLTLVVCGMRRFSPRIDWVWVSLHSTLRSLAFDLWITSSGTLSAVVLVDYIIAAVRSTRFVIPCCRFGRLSVAGLRHCRAIVSSFWITLLPLRLCLSLLDYAAAATVVFLRPARLRRRLAERRRTLVWSRPLDVDWCCPLTLEWVVCADARRCAKEIILLLDLSPPLVLAVAVLIYKSYSVRIKVWGRDSFLSLYFACSLINSAICDKTVSAVMFTCAQARKSGWGI